MVCSSWLIFCCAYSVVDIPSLIFVVDILWWISVEDVPWLIFVVWSCIFGVMYIL